MALTQIDKAVTVKDRHVSRENDRPMKLTNVMTNATDKSYVNRHEWMQTEMTGWKRKQMTNQMAQPSSLTDRDTKSAESDKCKAKNRKEKKDARPITIIFPIFLKHTL